MLKQFREPINGLTHFIAFLLAILGLVLLVQKSIDPLKIWHIVTFSIFGVGMVLLYLASTLYHWLPLSEKGVLRLKRVDHVMVFVMIAASYTPICLIPLRYSIGWLLFGVIWGLVVGGLLLKIFWIHAPRWLTATVYVAMGWLAILGIGPIANALQPRAFFWLISGGLLYTVGALIYAANRPNPWPNRFGAHEIFHIFVMFGSLSHYLMMYQYISVFK